MFLVYNVSLSAQYFSVNYESKIGPSITKNLPKEYLKLIETKKDQWILETDGKLSVFKPLSAKNSNKMELLVKNFTTKKTITKNISSEKLATDTMGKRNVVISKITKKILGYTCYKATLDTETFYFTKEIPIQDGPDNAYLLPGFILEYHNPAISYTATNIVKKEGSVVSPIK